MIGIKDALIGVHAIRTIAQIDSRGVPAPEGLHRDGFSYVGILACNAPPVGARTRLVRLEDAESIDVGMLRSGELILFNDLKYLHYTSEFFAFSEQVISRDVVVVTVSTADENLL